VPRTFEVELKSGLLHHSPKGLAFLKADRTVDFLFLKSALPKYL